MNLSGEQFTADQTQALWFEDSERHDAAMREVVDTIVMQSSQNQRFSGLFLNRDFAESGKPCVIIPGTFLGASNGPYRKYEAYQYAAAFPNNPVLLIDMPGHGLSDPSTSEQREEILFRKGLSKVGQAQTQAARNKLPQRITDIHLVGDSLGGRLIPEIALASTDEGFNPLAMVAHEMVGLDKRSSLSIAKGFYFDELKDQKRYRNDPNGAHLRDAFERRFKGVGPRKDLKNEVGELLKAGYDASSFSLYDVYRKDKILPILVLMRSPLASDHGFAVLEQALDTFPDITASLVSGGLSKVVRWQHIKQKVGDLKNQYGDRLSWEIWPNDSHSMGLTDQQPRLAKHAASAIALRNI